MKKGISLIVLIVTIIVIIILAAAVILTLNKNNPIDSSRVAQLADNRASLNSAVNLYYGKIMAETQGVYEPSEIFKDLDKDNTNIAKVSAALVDTTAANTVSITAGGKTTVYYPIATGNTSELLGMTLPTVANAAWFLDIDSGLVYLIYNENYTSTNAPDWMFTDTQHNTMDTTLSEFVKFRPTT